MYAVFEAKTSTFRVCKRNFPGYWVRQIMTLLRFNIVHNRISIADIGPMLLDASFPRINLKYQSDLSSTATSDLFHYHFFFTFHLLLFITALSSHRSTTYTDSNEQKNKYKFIFCDAHTAIIKILFGVQKNF